MGRMPLTKLGFAAGAEGRFAPSLPLPGMPARGEAGRQDAEQKRLRLERTYGTRQLRIAAERLASVQLRDGSLYSNLRTLVPVVVLASVWTWVNRGELEDAHRFLNRSVGVRHLLLAVLIGTLWNVWLVLSHIAAKRSSVNFARRFCGLLPPRVSAACCRW